MALRQELESIIAQMKTALLGESRVYLDVKKVIGERGRTQSIPDGYLLKALNSKLTTA